MRGALLPLPEGEPEGVGEIKIYLKNATYHSASARRCGAHRLVPVNGQRPQASAAATGKSVN